MIKLMLADDHDLVRTGLRRLLDDIEGIEVVAEVICGEDAVQKVKLIPIDVILMDINMPGIGGLEATRKILHKHPEIKVIIVTMNEDEVFAQRLLKAGAAGYLTKGCKITEITHAIREVMANKRYITPQIAQQLALADFKSQEERSPFVDLSERELQVMMMIMDGGKVNAISDKLCLSPKTISTYRQRLFSKLGISTDVELARLVLRYGVLQDK
ncbi:MAG: UvrY/SirA/GacA family response regulator transcription factor [Gammaproteobacteria bacterium]|nr:UvrY/SirA/GacA family response regulator transcription factor [Gammaproteobacteria bacterium]